MRNLADASTAKPALGTCRRRGFSVVGRLVIGVLAVAGVLAIARPSVANAGSFERMAHVELASVTIPETPPNRGYWVPATRLAVCPEGSVYVVVQTDARRLTIYRIEEGTAATVKQIPFRGRACLLPSAQGLRCAFLRGGYGTPFTVEIWSATDASGQPVQELNHPEGASLVHDGAPLSRGGTDHYGLSEIVQSGGNAYLIVGSFHEMIFSVGDWRHPPTFQKHFSIEWRDGRFQPLQRLDPRDRSSADMRTLVPCEGGVTHTLARKRSSTDETVCFRTHTAKLGWGEEEVVHSRPFSDFSYITSLELAASTDDLYALWTVGDEGAYMARRHQGRWSEAELIQATRAYPYPGYLRVEGAATAPGDVCHLLLQGRGCLILLSCVNGQWQSITLADRGEPSDTFRGSIAVDSSGTIHLAYAGLRTDEQAVAVYETYRLTAATSTSEPTPP